MEDSFSKKVLRAEYMLSRPHIEQVLASPEHFVRWVENASFEDFSFFLSGINYALYAHIGTPEKSSEDISRGVKETLNMVVKQEVDDLGEHLFAVFVPPHGEELQNLFGGVFKKFKSLIKERQFTRAGVLLSQSIVLLQPFPDGNKRTARAVSLLMRHMHTKEPLDIPRFTKEYFASAESAVNDILKESDAAFAVFSYATRTLMDALLQERNVSAVFDKREDESSFAAWDYHGIFIPEVPFEIETYLKVDAKEASDILLELRSIMSLYNENLPIQIAPVVAFLTLEAYPEYTLRQHVETKNEEGQLSMNVPLFVRTLLRSLDEPLSAEMLQYFIQTFRHLQKDALEVVLDIESASS